MSTHSNIYRADVRQKLFTQVFVQASSPEAAREMVERAIQHGDTWLLDDAEIVATEVEVAPEPCLGQDWWDVTAVDVEEVVR